MKNLFLIFLFILFIPVQTNVATTVTFDEKIEKCTSCPNVSKCCKDSRKDFTKDHSGKVRIFRIDLGILTCGYSIAFLWEKNRETGKKDYKGFLLSKTLACPIHLGCHSGSVYKENIQKITDHVSCLCCGYNTLILDNDTCGPQIGASMIQENTASERAFEYLNH